MHPSLRSSVRFCASAGGFGRWLQCACLCAAAVGAAGCHRHNYNSGYGVAWVTLTSEPGNFASYVVNIDSVTLTDAKGHTYTALANVEPIDLVKLGNVAELWGSATIPDDTYVSAAITLDYTTAAISVLVNGVPQKATVTGPTGSAVKTVTTIVKFDAAQPLVIAPSYATSNAVRLAIDFDLPASNSVDFATTPAAVTVHPFLTAGGAASDTKLIRVRGPLVNSSVTLGTYTVYERPFYDEVSNIGTLTIFNGQSTIYTVNGTTYVGAPGLTALSQSSAGSTLTSAYTTFEPTPTPTGMAGKFNSVYVLAGSSLESFYTENLSGVVIARNGNTLTVRGATVYGATAHLANGYFGYQDTDAQVLLGPGTIVTAEGNAALGTLDYRSIGVGQLITAIGTYSLSSAGVVSLDATSPTAGQVRLQSTQAFGQLLSASAGNAAVTLQALDIWPAGVFNFAGSGATSAQDAAAANFQINTGATDLSGTAAGTPVWADGFVNAFGAAPPDFNAVDVNLEAVVPASLQVQWTSPGTATPFTGLSSSGFSIDLGNASLASAVIAIGAESIDLRTLPASPQVVPTATAVSTTFSPLFAVGSAAAGISGFSSFPSFVTDLNTAVTGSAPVIDLQARGLYDRSTNTFIADTVDVVL